jgi:hypothetical protein
MDAINKVMGTLVVLAIAGVLAWMAYTYTPPKHRARPT